MFDFSVRGLRRNKLHPSHHDVFYKDVVLAVGQTHRWWLSTQTTCKHTSSAQANGHLP